MKTNNINANAITSVFNAVNKGFNAQARFVYNLTNAEPEKIPACPDKNDKSAEAENLRAEIRRAKTFNKAIEDARQICDILNITANDVANANKLSKLRERILARIPNKTKFGLAVKFVNLPGLLKTVAGAENYKIVSIMKPFEFIAEACNWENENTTRIFVPTIAPHVESQTNEDGDKEIILYCASGDIVNAKGQTLTGERYTELLTIWNNRAKANYFANKAGQAEADKVREKTIKAETLKATETLEGDEIKTACNKPEKADEPKAETAGDEKTGAQKEKKEEKAPATKKGAKKEKKAA